MNSRSFAQHGFRALIGALALAIVVPAQGRAQTDIIRGRITGPDNKAVATATVTATSITGSVSRSARTDADGKFTISFPGDEGDYFVSIAALGFAAKRFEVKRTADQEVLLADAKLTTQALVLNPVNVNGQRQKVSRNDNSSDIGGNDRGINMSALAADQQGNLAAMAASIPGVQLIPSADGGPPGFSILGLGADQNQTTLNGLNYSGNDLPRDANVSTNLSTSPYDVSKGGFSGGQLNVRAVPGSNYISRTMSLNVDAPSLQWTDPAAKALGQQYTNLSLGGSVSGPISLDKAFYNFSYQLGQRSSDLQTLLNIDPLGLRTAGVSSDSVSRLLSILGPMGVPFAPRHALDSKVSDQGSIFGSFDLNPPSSTTGQTFNLTTTGSWNKQAPVTASATELPAHSGDRINWNGALMGRHSAYFGVGILSETSLGFSQSHSYGDPYEQLPSGAVRVASVFDDSTTTTHTLTFGGSPSLDNSQKTSSVDALNQLSWFSQDNKHKIKMTEELRRDALNINVGNNLLGTFNFNSLGDLSTGTPASYTRQLTSYQRSIGEWISAFSLGDFYRPNPDVQIQYGVRVDGNHFVNAPTTNPEVDQLFGTPNDHVPNHFYASPRIGFSWTQGQASQVAAFDGAVRGPRAVIRGGIGVFQNIPQASVLGSAMDNTGLPSGAQQLNCVGTAAPSPNWAGYLSDPGTVPDRCTDGSLGTVFANTSPNVSLFSKDYVPTRSVRSNLQWTGAILDNRFRLVAGGTYSLNLNQPSMVDLNFDPTTRFTLSDEDDRPVFAHATSIVSTTGAIASGDARLYPQLARVGELRSDLRSVSKQLQLSLIPAGFSTGLNWSLSYVYGNVREQFRGFSSTAGNPFDVDWSRSSLDSRHQISYNLSYNAFNAVQIAWNGSVRSGSPYTPSVAGDINGDGLSSNDRAFVFDPATTSDSATRTAMRTLLATASPTARACLERALGRIADRNSCQGPWSTQANVSLRLNPLRFHLPQRAGLSLQISNPLGAADLLLHGQSDLRGWGQPANPDATLLSVHGFNPNTQQFAYDVNQRFGSTRPQTNAIRAPVVVTAMMRVDVGPTREEQSLLQQLDRGRTASGSKMPEALIKAVFASAGVSNPMAAILRQADTLKLTQAQADSLAILNRWYSIKSDSIWTPVAKYLANLPTEFDHGEAYGRYKGAREQTIDLLIGVAPSLRSLLTPTQYRQLPAFITGTLDTRYLASIRSGTAGGGGGSGMGGLGGGGMTMVSGGGAGMTMITIVK